MQRKFRERNATQVSILKPYVNSVQSLCVARSPISTRSPISDRDPGRATHQLAGVDATQRRAAHRVAQHTCESGVFGHHTCIWTRDLPNVHKVRLFGCEHCCVSCSYLTRVRTCTAFHVKTSIQSLSASTPLLCTSVYGNVGAFDWNIWSRGVTKAVVE